MIRPNMWFSSPCRIAGALLIACAMTASTAGAQISWEPVWADEFDGDAVDPARWSFQIGDGCPNCGWGNGELQYYREENATVSGGVLVITAREENFGGYAYTSARMRTINKGDWLYGRVEVSAKMPTGQGLWPAIWMMPTESVYGGWAASGEIDIMELRGNEPSVVYGTLHYGGSFPNNTGSGDSYRLPAGDFSQAFHEFALEWDPWEIRWYVDDSLYQTQRSWFTANASYPAPFDELFHLILNVAVGGNFGGDPDASTVFPQTMEIDYARVFRAVNADPSITLTAPSDGTDYNVSDTAVLTAEATDADGQVDKVEFFQDEGLIGVARQIPYSASVENVSQGCYKLRARVTDNVGRTAVTPIADVTVGGGCADRSPYLMAPATIPGTVEAEHFDIGGNGVTYRDLTAGNIGDGIRQSDDVDVFTAGSDVGYAVTRIARGEWLEYTVNVKETAVYSAIVRIGSPALSASFRLEFDGVDKTGTVSVPTTGGERTWTNLVVPGIELEAGLHTMRIATSTGAFGLNRILFQKTGSVSVDETPKTSFRLMGSYPNPASDRVTVAFELDASSRITIAIVDMLGRVVANRATAPLPPGQHRVALDTRSLPAGVYAYRIATTTASSQGVMTVVKR